MVIGTLNFGYRPSLGTPCTVGFSYFILSFLMIAHTKSGSIFSWNIPRSARICTKSLKYDVQSPMRNKKQRNYMRRHTPKHSIKMVTEAFKIRSRHVYDPTISGYGIYAPIYTLNSTQTTTKVVAAAKESNWAWSCSMQIYLHITTSQQTL